MNTTPNSNRPVRRGGLTLELIIALPILLTVVFAIVQYSLILISTQALAAAANVAAREASLPSATETTVTQAAARALQGWGFAGDVDTFISVGGSPVGPSNRLEGSLTGEEVGVTLRVAATKVTPDLLKFIGMSIQNTQLSATQVMRKE